jgi:hypothetical protein
MSSSTEPLVEASEDTIRSLAGKLEEYTHTLTEEERALLEHLLLMALPPMERRRLSPEPGILSDADEELLGRLQRKES